MRKKKWSHTCKLLYCMLYGTVHCNRLIAVYCCMQQLLLRESVSGREPLFACVCDSSRTAATVLIRLHVCTSPFIVLQRITLHCSTQHSCATHCTTHSFRSPVLQHYSTTCRPAKPRLLYSKQTEHLNCSCLLYFSLAILDALTQPFWLHCLRYCPAVRCCCFILLFTVAFPPSITPRHHLSHRLHTCLHSAPHTIHTTPTLHQQKPLYTTSNVARLTRTKRVKQRARQEQRAHLQQGRTSLKRHVVS